MVQPTNTPYVSPADRPRAYMHNTTCIAITNHRRYYSLAPASGGGTAAPAVLAHCSAAPAAPGPDAELAQLHLSLQLQADAASSGLDTIPWARASEQWMAEQETVMARMIAIFTAREDGEEDNFLSWGQYFSVPNS
nr:unnamed protein product [Digitaria exilis]